MKVASLTLQRLKLPLQEHPRNPRIHPKEGSEEWNLLSKSLKDAYFDPIVWNKRNGKLVSGHLRQKVLVAEGCKLADCVVVDWPEQKHIAKMIAANRGMGEDDGESLRLLLAEEGIDLQLTGLTENMVNLILHGDQPDDPNKEWEGLPEFIQNAKGAWKTIAVHFKDEDGMKKFGKLIGQGLTEKTKSIWHPKGCQDQLGQGLAWKSTNTDSQAGERMNPQSKARRL